MTIKITDAKGNNKHYSAHNIVVTINKISRRLRISGNLALFLALVKAEWRCLSIADPPFTHTFTEPPDQWQAEFNASDSPSYQIWMTWWETVKN